MGHWFYRNIVEPGKLPLLLALGSFVVTFLVTRTITRLIRAGRGPFRNVTPGGLHIHHVVPGVVLALLGGFGGVATSQYGAASAFCAVLFGIGAGLILDEFALIVHLDDVYWTEQGRQSVEAVALTAALLLLLLIGSSPLGVDSLTADQAQDRASFVATVVVNFLFVLATLAKGKLRMAVVGVLVPLVALVGAVRLARPGSWWARRLYRRRPRARARAGLRAYHHDRRWDAIGRRFGDLVAGRPTDELPTAATSEHKPPPLPPKPPSLPPADSGEPPGSGRGPSSDPPEDPSSGEDRRR
ncbi:hypothetical protein [Streptomyces lichenis]|uniref:hypothetical protein n=1 Tax=Streptomyces lichenis TaxID=2306967 RepID=UPI0027E382CD|nr:hypothetical protein [Streptomyces lichenis]